MCYLQWSNGIRYRHMSKQTLKKRRFFFVAVICFYFILFHLRNVFLLCILLFVSLRRSMRYFFFTHSFLLFTHTYVWLLSVYWSAAGIWWYTYTRTDKYIQRYTSRTRSLWITISAPSTQIHTHTNTSKTGKFHTQLNVLRDIHVLYIPHIIFYSIQILLFSFHISSVCRQIFPFFLIDMRLLRYFVRCFVEYSDMIRTALLLFASFYYYELLLYIYKWVYKCALFIT